jgi:hypothetical protein
MVFINNQYVGGTIFVPLSLLNHNIPILQEVY